MESAEIESLVVELETRVDRLRSLYDMYFMGIERLEPLVPRKDVERRLQQLRKEQIRNTGTRFRFQMIVQRFNTYITYWQRISRQIEQGTYKRDVMRAQARFGVNPAKERVQEDAPAKRDSAAADAAVATAPAPYELEDLSEDISMSLEDDLLGDIQALPPRAVTAPLPQERFVSAAKLELDDFADPFEELDPFPKPLKAAAPKVRLATRPGGPAAPSVPPVPQESRDTDRRIPAAPPPTALSMKPEPRVIVAKRASIPDAQEVAASVPAPPPSAPRVAPAAPGGAPRIQVRAPAPAAPATPPQAAPVVRQASPVVATRPAAPANAPPPRPAAPAPAPVRAVPVSAGASPAPAPPALAKPAAPAPVVARPPVAAPPPQAPAPSPQARPAAVAAPAQPPRPTGDLSGDRFGQIYSQYVETRRKQNEPTGAITRDALAKQLDESTTRLKQKHAGKAIDFEVVVKDGRTILRPVVK